VYQFVSMLVSLNNAEIIVLAMQKMFCYFLFYDLDLEKIELSMITELTKSFEIVTLH